MIQSLASPSCTSTEALILKYNVSAPRYTSYPTVPFWEPQAPTAEQWFSVVDRTFGESNAEKGISLYVHLPFCESLCTYCGCNKRITKNHGVEEGYIRSLLAEWQTYLSRFPTKPRLRELHLGGGTPTFFRPRNLRILLEGIYAGAEIHPEREFSFEGHPNNTTAEHLQTLYDLGFRRVSYGIQDFDLKVQVAVNRIQPFENVERATREARAIGYESVNYDLIYGLPHQTLESVRATIDQVACLLPDRIAFYSYAHVPWASPSQRGYSEADLPSAAEKRALYELGLAKLQALGYVNIGMDHFALPQDALTLAHRQGTLHRNFMGYTTSHTDLLLGLGASAISDAKYAYLQNQKGVESYQKEIEIQGLAPFKGHLLTPDDLLRKEAILELACQGKLNITGERATLLDPATLRAMREMESEGLLIVEEREVQVTALGQAFVRNICLLFDQKLKASTLATDKLFSKAI